MSWHAIPFVLWFGGQQRSYLRIGKPGETHHSSFFIPSVNSLRPRQNTRDARGSIAAVLALGIDVVQLLDEFELELAVDDRLVPHLDPR